MPLEQDIADLKAGLALLHEQILGLVKRALREHDESQRASATIGCEELAQLLGCQGGGATSLSELGRRRARRDREIMSLCLVGGNGRTHYRWRRRDIVDLLAGRRQARLARRG